MATKPVDTVQRVKVTVRVKVHTQRMVCAQSKQTILSACRSVFLLPVCPCCFAGDSISSYERGIPCSSESPFVARRGWEGISGRLESGA